MRAIDVVQAYCDAWMAGDVATVASMYHEDLTLEWFGEHRLAGTHVGLQRSIEALLELQAATNRTPTEIVEILDGPSSVVAIVNERWTSANGDDVFEPIPAASSKPRRPVSTSGLARRNPPGALWIA